MKLSIFATVALNNVIGLNGEQPWKLPSVKARFDAITMGRHILMGKHTFSSFSESELRGRRVIVLSNGSHQLFNKLLATVAQRRGNVTITDSLFSAVGIAATRGESELIVIGGESVFAEAMPLATRLYLTKVQTEVAGDAFFPHIKRDDWSMLSAGAIPMGVVGCENSHPLAFYVFNKQPQIAASS